MTIQFDAIGVGASVSVINTPPLFVQFEISTDPGRPFTVEKAVTPSVDVAAQVPLGTFFSVKLVKKLRDGSGNTTIVPVGSVYSDGADSIKPLFKNNFSLFTTSTMVKLSGDSSTGQSIRYVALHLGKHTFVMLPSTIPGASAVTVNVDVIRPTELGTTHNEFDKRIIDAAHETGMLPQFMKGQIQQESDFNRTSFRYEPCSWDFASVSAGATRIAMDPYKTYAMDNALSIAGLSPTIDLRDSLYVPDGTVDKNSNIGIRHINPGERGVTAKNIWIASDIRPSGPGAGRGEKWSTKGCDALDTFLETHSFAQFIDALDFTAQTPTASSYGLMQVMWGLVEDYRWNVDDPDRPGQTTQSPRYLVDTPEAIALQRGGSILIGSQEDVKHYWDSWGPNGEPSVFASQQAFYDSFKKPLRKYTGGGKGTEQYGINIIDTNQFDYLPKAPTTFFP